jgi:hypothetical protein
MYRLLLRGVAAVTVCLATTAVGQGQTVASWDFGTSNLPGQSTGPQFSPTVTNPNVTVTDILLGSGNINQEVDSPLGQNNQTYPSAPFNRVFTATVVSNTEAASLLNDAFINFTVTPNAGFMLNLTGFSMQVGRGGLGGNRATYVYDSVDGFALGSSITRLETLANDTTLTRPNSTTIMADLTPARYQNLTTPITFRIYIASDAGGQSMDLDNIALTGTVIVVPEPTGVLALAVGAGALWTLRRRRRSEKPAQVSVSPPSCI